jgi:tetratricopeptide (TPR) repeat protein
MDYKECIVNSTQALDRIENFHDDTSSFQSNNILAVKILMRRAKCYEMTDEYALAKEDIDRTIMLEPKNEEARNLLKSIQSKLDTKLFTQYRDEANELLKGKKFFEALEMYEKCLKVTRKATTLDNISIYVNKIACLLFLDKLERVNSEANEAIRLIRNFRNRNEATKMSKEDKERLRQMDLRVAVRKGNALAKLARTTDAISEYERALRIDPGNTAVQKDLDKIRKQ